MLGKPKSTKVAVGKSGGFCFGIQKAFQLVMDKANRCQPMYIMGELAHNKQVSSLVEKAGIKKIKSLEEIEKGFVIFTAHGARPEDYQQAREKGLKIIDATCPRVMRVELLAKKETERGRQVVVFGDREHKEVKNILAWSNNKALIIDSLAEAEKLKLDPNQTYCLLSQTTQDLNSFQEITKCLKRRLGRRLICHQTICPASQERQEEIKKMAKRNDTIIIVGSKNSANSNRLFQVAKNLNDSSYFIDDETELNPDWLKGKKSIAVIAGASTLEETVAQIVSKIDNLTN